MRKKRCKFCENEFIPLRPLAVVCSWPCGHALILKNKEKADAKKAKAERAEIRVRKDKLKTRRDYINEAQIAFNAYIRNRDARNPCICCGVALSAGQVGGGFDAGHYRSVGSAPHLRFNENNCHGQRKQCNRYGAGRAVDYRIGLISRIGLDAVEALESDHTVKKWSIDDLKAIRDEYRAKLKELKARTA